MSIVRLVTKCLVVREKTSIRSGHQRYICRGLEVGTSTLIFVGGYEASCCKRM